MSSLNERYSDLVGDLDDPALLTCVADLDATCAAFALSAERDAALSRTLAGQGHDASGRPARTPQSKRTWPGAHWRTARVRIASLTLAALLAAGGIGGYLHGQGPTPVSAQTVLHRAAAAGPGPNEATHSTYRVSASGGYTGAAEVWVGTDAMNAPTEFALSVTMLKDGRPAPELSSRRVLAGSTMQAYDPASNTVTISSPGGPDQELGGIFVGVLVAQKLSRALDAAKQPLPFTLKQQTLDGVPVYALKLDQTGSQTFYFDTQSYELEGVDWVQAGRSWQARLDPANRQTMGLSAVPAHTFTLNAPSTAHVVTLAPTQTSKRPADDPIMSAAAAACNATVSTFSAAVQAGDKSMLAICQETNPGMTVDRLVTALMAPLKTKLDAQVTSGALTPAQESDELANVRIKLTRMVTSQPSTGSGSKQP